MGRLGLGNDEDACRALVDPVHDPGAFNTADTGQLSSAMIQQGVHKRALPAAGRGMDRHTGRLVQQNEVLVLEKYIERNVFRLRRRWHRVWHVEVVGIARRHARLRVVGGLAIEADRAFLDQGFRARPRKLRQSLGQEAVEPRSLVGVGRGGSECVHPISL